MNCKNQAKFIYPNKYQNSELRVETDRNGEGNRRGSSGAVKVVWNAWKICHGEVALAD